MTFHTMWLINSLIGMKSLDKPIMQFRRQFYDLDRSHLLMHYLIHRMKIHTRKRNDETFFSDLKQICQTAITIFSWSRTLKKSIKFTRNGFAELLIFQSKRHILFLRITHFIKNHLDVEYSDDHRFLRSVAMRCNAIVP